jgi:glycosyltransferase involved in cell wall biosynthesis
MARVLLRFASCRCDGLCRHAAIFGRHQGAAVLHSHDFGPVTFIRRYFDEFRGLRAVDGFVEPFGVRSKWPEVRTQVECDRAWMRDQGTSAAAIAGWTARSYFHHATRKAAMVAGTHPERIPVFLQRAISLERGPLKEVSSVPRVVTSRGPSPWETVLTFARDGPAPLADPIPGMARAKRLHIAVVVPPFTRGSGGHTSIFRLVRELDKRGHTVSTWLHDPEGRMASKSPATVADELRDFFGAPRGPVFDRFDEWSGADVALATGWDTAYRVAGLRRCRARAYLVQDREAEFFATSAQALWADASYETGLDPIVTSRWLAEVVASRIGRAPPVVDPGVDHDTYRVRDVRRRNDTVIFYAREATPRRAVPLGVLALAELHRRRPNTRFVLFGHDAPLRAPFPYHHVGVASPPELAEHYAVATVGLCLSLTNRSLVPDEMLACGLPCVELAAPDPLAIAQALEHLLDDPGERSRRAEAGLAAVAGRTWEGASRQLETALRDILKAREARSR